MHRGMRDVELWFAVGIMAGNISISREHYCYSPIICTLYHPIMRVESARL